MTTFKDPILLQINGEIAIITLNLPHKLNALTGDLYRQLGYTLRKIAEMPDVVITILTGSGRYFSAGADVGGVSGGGMEPGKGEDERTFWLRNFAANNLEITTAFATHPKLLITALNGPVVGLSAALVAHSDFIYSLPHAFLLTPFTSLGLVSEGASAYTLVQRLGLSKANEALILSQRISASDLLQCGFLNKLYPMKTGEREDDCRWFVEQVVQDVRKGFLERGLNKESMLLVKGLIRKSFEEKVERVNQWEVFAGVERFVGGSPQGEFAALKDGRKKHKL